MKTPKPAPELTRKEYKQVIRLVNNAHTYIQKSSELLIEVSKIMNLPLILKKIKYTETEKTEDN